MNYTQRRGVSGDPGQHGWREEQSLEKDVLHALLEILELEVDDYEDNDDMSRIRSRFKGNLCPPAAQKKCRAKSTIRSDAAQSCYNQVCGRGSATSAAIRTKET